MRVELPPARPELSGAARLRRLRVVVGTVLGIVTILRGPAEIFVYDAGVYFAGSRALVTGGTVFEAGGLGLRGVFTAFVYLPAAVVVEMLGDGAAGAAVLVENAVLISVIGAVLLPRMLGVWRTVTPAAVVVCAIGAGVVLSGFAPYPLTDLWAAALLLVALVALDHRSRLWLVGAGLAAGGAINIRPAMLLPVVAVSVAVLVARRSSAGWALLGVVVALTPQFLLNVWHGDPWWPVPERTGWLSELQAYHAAQVVRYDTVVGVPDASPSLFWCSPDMVEALDGTVVHSPGELAAAFLGTFPHSLVFSAQKIGAALHWPVATPYFHPRPILDGGFAVLVTVLAVVGAAVLLRRTISRSGPASLGQVGGVLAWTACVVGLTTSATETRFALPIALFGVVGVAALAAGGLRLPRQTRGWLWVAGTVAVAGLAFGAGVSGMQHGKPDGASAAVCMVDGEG